MSIRTPSDAIYSALAWLPILAIVVFCLWVVAHTVLFVEIRSEGTEHFLPNSASIDHWNKQDIAEHRAAMAELGM